VWRSLEASGLLEMDWLRVLEVLRIDLSGGAGVMDLVLSVLEIDWLRVLEVLRIDLSGGAGVMDLVLSTVGARFDVEESWGPTGKRSLLWCCIDEPYDAVV